MPRTEADGELLEYMEYMEDEFVEDECFGYNWNERCMECPCYR